MTFHGWPEEALDFYDGLEADNSRAYWTANSATYESSVLGPMAELVDELAPDFGEGKIFRPYRDLRFSKDKSPYKTAIGAVIGDGYVRLSARGLAAGNGMYSMAPDQLERYRRAVASEVPGRELAAVISAARRRKIDVHGHEVLKTAPRGYPADHPRIELLRYKGMAGVAGRAMAHHGGRQGAHHRFPRRDPAAGGLAGRARRCLDGRARPPVARVLRKR